MSRPVRAVALGGGHGLHASLSALRRITSELTAIVTVADDGGSSGRIRRELRVLPPGDLRMALAALAGSDPEHARWADLLQHRIGGSGALAGHPVGNLMLTALLEETRRLGYAISDEELELGLRSIAVPIHDQVVVDGQPVLVAE
ncbi:MAG: YvcK family protein [Actinobacteria bacterium]|nr:YvcK family protein [Actinomycetota bacterium]